MYTSGVNETRILQSNATSLKTAAQVLLGQMDELWMPPGWFDEVLGSEALCSLFGVELKSTIESQHTEPEPLMLFDRLAGSWVAPKLQEELMASRFEQEILEASAPTTPGAKPPSLLSKSSQLVSMRSDAARRKEIAALKLEVRELEVYIEYLTHKAVSQPEEHSSLHKCQLVNSKLRELTRLQQLWISRGLSVASYISPQSSTTLLNYSIHLPRETPDRVKILCNLSGGILHDGREILRERMRFLSGNLLPCNEASSYTTAEGDMCATMFAATPIQDLTNVKQVFDALRSVLTSEMAFVCQKTRARSMTETVDAHPNLDENGIAHRLCIRSSPTGVVTEFNSVLFSEYPADTDSTGLFDNEAQATIVIHPVEKDKLHPYTAGRLRLDVTSVISIHHQKYSLEHDSSSSHLSSKTTEGIAVVRSTFIKLYRDGVSISASDLRKEMNYAMSKGPAALEAAMALLARQ